MAQYIDKDILVAEIERLYDEKGAFYAADVLYNLEEWIDTLEVKEVDLNEEPQVKESAEIQHVNDMCKENSNSLTQEPVSADLKEAADNALENITDQYDILDVGGCLEMFKLGAKWQKKQDQEIIETAIHHAYHNGRLEMKEKMMAKLWKPADGDELPEYEREVVAFQEIFPTDVDVPSLLKIVIAHRPNPEGYDGKSITTGQVEHYTPKTYDKGGWNIPNIKYWLDVELPKEIEL